MSSPRYKMIAIDLDGTLLSPTGKVTDRTKFAIHACLRSGILVCFATGRNFTESKTVLDAVEHYSTAVFVGGAMVIDTGQRVTLHRTMVEPQLAREVCATIEEAGHAVLACQDTETAGVDYLVSANIAVNPETEHWMKVTKATVKLVPDLATYPHHHTIRLGIVAASDDMKLVRQRLELRFAERVFLQSIFVPTANIDVLEIFDPSVNKWEGILHVARKHEIDPSQIIAIGDDLNDIQMIKSAGLGVAMGNARPEIKAIAKQVIGTNEDEGLASFLEELVRRHAVSTLRDEAAA